jgi:hypothetical protein
MFCKLRVLTRAVMVSMQMQLLSVAGDTHGAKRC